MDIERIQKNLQERFYFENPGEAVNDRGVLAGEYSFICGILEDIAQRKPDVWNKIRKEVKSDASAEKTWQTTEDGKNETVLEIRRKRVEKMMSALSTLFELHKGQGNNIF